MKNRYYSSLGLIFLLIMIWIIGQISFAEEPIKVIAASATSSSDDSLPVTDLLDLNKEGSWKPKASDLGVNEGLFFQFQKPVSIDWIEIKVKGDSHSFGIDYYLDGKRNPPSKVKKKSTDDNSDNALEYGSSYEDIGNDNLLITLGAQEYGKSEDTYRSLGKLNVKVTSIFFRISYAKDKAEILSVRFFKGNTEKPLSVIVPQTVIGNVTATSTLPPYTAYNILNLFDSRLEFAWATNGKKTNGIGESFTITINNGDDLSGLIIWNGYQRSETHYYANERPSKLKLETNTGEKFELLVKDKMGSQLLTFPKIIENVNSLKVTIEAFYPGKSYKDLVISELKLVDKTGNVVIVNTPSVKLQVQNPDFERILDISLAPYMLGIRGDKEIVEEWFSPFEASYNYPHKSIRFRSNGSFVCYSDAGIMEGNWEPLPNGVRIFGKKYSTNPYSSIYLQELKNKTSVKIYQEIIFIIDPSKISFEEARRIFKPILAERFFYTPLQNKSSLAIWWMGIEPFEEAKITGKSDYELIKKALKIAIEKKAIILKSSLFTDLFLSNDEIIQTYFYEPW